MSIHPQRTRPTPADEHRGALSSVLEALAAAPACWWFGVPWWRFGRRGPR